MGFLKDSKSRPSSERKQESGIALFMVLASMGILAILVTEFTYMAQVSNRIAYDGLDQVQVHYLAKSAYKLSLLRLKAYQQIKSFVKQQGVKGMPKTVLDRIWSFPFMYPIPTDLPGLSMIEKDQIKKFQDNSGLNGRFSSLIEGESSRINLNSIVPGFAPPAPSPSPSPGSPSPTPGASPSPQPSFNPEQARQSLLETMNQIWNQKLEKEPSFSDDYRDFKVEDLVDNMVAWADRTYERRSRPTQESIDLKRAPFYTLSELRLMDQMDDTLYELFSPQFTVAGTTGVNVNTVQEGVLRILLPKITDDEVKEFFKVRDDPENPVSFNSPDEFYKLVKEKFASYGSDTVITALKEDHQKRSIYIITDENRFKISVQAQVNQATRLIEAWVELEETTETKSGASNSADSAAPSTPLATPPPTNATQSKAGLKITFMRSL